MKLLIEITFICIIIMAVPDNDSNQVEFDGTIKDIDSSFLSSLKYRDRNLNDTNKCVQLWKSVFERAEGIELNDDHESIMKTYNSQMLIRLVEIMNSRSTVYKDNSLTIYLSNCAQILSEETHNEEKYNYNIEKVAVFSRMPQEVDSHALIERLKNLQNVYKIREEIIKQVKEKRDNFEKCGNGFEDCIGLLNDKCLNDGKQLNKDIDLVKNNYDAVMKQLEEIRSKSIIKSKDVFELEQIIKSVRQETEKYKNSALIYEQKLDKKKILSSFRN